MNISQEIKLYDILKGSIGTLAAEAFLQLMETKTEGVYDKNPQGKNMN